METHIHPEAIPPGHMVCQGPAHERAEDAGQSEACSEQSLIASGPVQRERLQKGKGQRGQTHVGLSASVVISIVVWKAVPKMPAAPTPASARPKMRTSMDGATAQTSEPTSKMTTVQRKTYFEGVNWRIWALQTV